MFGVQPTSTPRLALASIAELSALDTANLVTGDIVWVSGIGFYQLRKDWAGGVNSSILIATANAGTSGVGAWLGLPGVNGGSTFVTNVGPASNVADLTAFTVAGNDGVTNIEGDIVLLYHQTTATQNGLYVVGVVTTGTAPLTKLTDLSGEITVIQVIAGTLFGSTEWKNTSGTTWYPKSATQLVTLAAGLATVTNVPILSATKSGFYFFRTTAGTLSTSGTAIYACPGTTSVSAGINGTVCFAGQTATGATNALDTSSGNFTITNW